MSRSYSNIESRESAHCVSQLIVQTSPPCQHLVWSMSFDCQADFQEVSRSAWERFNALRQRLNDFVSFARGEEKIGFEAVLTSIKIVITTVAVVESLVTATFHDSSLFYD